MLAAGHTHGVILLQGGEQTTRYDTDHEPVFRQESYFQYAFGVSESSVFGAISLPSATATLFVPKLGEDYEVFCGAYPPPDDFRARYGVEDVRYLDELPQWLDEQLAGGEKEGAEETTSEGADEKERDSLYLLSGLNSDSGNLALPASFEGIEAFKSHRDLASLFPAIAEARVTKSAAEIEVLRYVNWVSSMAHVEVMRAARPGMMEYQLEGLFQHHTYTHGGCRHMAYTCICACGPNPAILHYGHAGRPNARQIRNGDMALLDMGAEYHCYAADITCSFPIVAREAAVDGGSDGSARDTGAAGGAFFSANQRVTYEAVLDAQRAVIGALKPGVSWTDMHRLAERTILRALLAAGVLRTPAPPAAAAAAAAARGGAGALLDEAAEVEVIVDGMLAADLGAVFMPHGLGHLIGLDTHDVGGYLEGQPERSPRPGLSKLRTARKIECGMVLTVEPGCYFIGILLDRALANPAQARYLVPERLDEFRGTGGVRLEDDVHITAAGEVENLTLCPRTVEEVEAVLAGDSWPPSVDRAPELRRAWCAPNAETPGGRMVKTPI